jgi:hypothetical protein
MFKEGSADIRDFGVEKGSMPLTNGLRNCGSRNINSLDGLADQKYFFLFAALRLGRVRIAGLNRASRNERCNFRPFPVPMEDL